MIAKSGVCSFEQINIRNYHKNNNNDFQYRRGFYILKYWILYFEVNQSGISVLNIDQKKLIIYLHR